MRYGLFVVEIKYLIVLLSFNILESQNDGEQASVCLYVLLLSLSGHNSQGWIRPKPEARKLILVSHVGDRDSYSHVLHAQMYSSAALETEEPDLDLGYGHCKCQLPW